jgi:hypothetical protein
MARQDNGEHLKLWTPATYRIEVEGHLNESWSERLAGMRITRRRRADQTTVTTLVGELRDQAELTGALNSLYELHMPILSVKSLNEKDGERGHAPDKSSRSGAEAKDSAI